MILAFGNEMYPDLGQGYTLSATYGLLFELKTTGLAGAASAYAHSAAPLQPLRPLPNDDT